MNEAITGGQLRWQFLIIVSLTGGRSLWVKWGAEEILQPVPRTGSLQYIRGRVLLRRMVWRNQSPPTRLQQNHVPFGNGE